MTKLIIRWIFLILLLFLAIVFSGAASKSGIAALFLVGIGFEAVFWYFFTRKKKVVKD